MLPFCEFELDSGRRKANPCCLRNIITAGSVFVSESTFPDLCSSPWNFVSSTAIPRLPPTRDRKSVIVAWLLLRTAAIAEVYPKAFKSCLSFDAVPSPPPIAYFLQFMPPASTVSPLTFKFRPNKTFGFPNRPLARVGSERVASVLVPGAVVDTGTRFKELYGGWAAAPALRLSEPLSDDPVVMLSSVEISLMVSDISPLEIELESSKLQQKDKTTLRTFTNHFESCTHFIFHNEISIERIICFHYL